MECREQVQPQATMHARQRLLMRHTLLSPRTTAGPAQQQARGANTVRPPCTRAAHSQKAGPAAGTEERSDSACKEVQRQVILRGSMTLHWRGPQACGACTSSKGGRGNQLNNVLSLSALESTGALRTRVSSLSPPLQTRTHLSLNPSKLALTEAGDVVVPRELQPRLDVSARVAELRSRKRADTETSWSAQRPSRACRLLCAS